MPEANWWVAVVFSSFRLPTPSCLQVSVQMKRSRTPDMPVSFLWCWLLKFGVDYSRGCSQLPHGEGIRTLCKIFSAFFPTHWEFLSKKAWLPPVSSPWNPPFPPGGEPASRDAVNADCPGPSALAFSADRWVARDASPPPASRGAGHQRGWRCPAGVRRPALTESQNHRIPE